MCLAVPGQITSLHEGDPLQRSGQVSFAGVLKEVNLSLLPEAKVGDYVIVHAGLAISLVDEAEAAETLRLFEEIGSFAPQEERPA
jgi:hydrogenase expression/formation protein HypC